MRTYSELIKLPTFRERYEYLKLSGRVGEETFGYDRYLNQIFYKSSEWKTIREEVIVRDMGCDLALVDHEIVGLIFVHHMNPVSERDIFNRSDFLLNPEFLVSCSAATHNAIHYGDAALLYEEPIIRRPRDTILW